MAGAYGRLACVGGTKHSPQLPVPQLIATTNSNSPIPLAPAQSRAPTPSPNTALIWPQEMGLVPFLGLLLCFLLCLLWQCRDLCKIWVCLSPSALTPAVPPDACETSSAVCRQSPFTISLPLTRAPSTCPSTFPCAALMPPNLRLCSRTRCVEYFLQLRQRCDIGFKKATVLNLGRGKGRGRVGGGLRFRVGVHPS